MLRIVVIPMQELNGWQVINTAAALIFSVQSLCPKYQFSGVVCPLPRARPGTVVLLFKEVCNERRRVASDSLVRLKSLSRCIDHFANVILISRYTGLTNSKRSKRYFTFCLPNPPTLNVSHSSLLPTLSIPSGEMGRRHQLFIIGNINGRYRQLCAIHAQWLYGEEVLERCVDILQILEHDTNRLAIQQELIAAANKSDDFWNAPAHDLGIVITPVLFPFITTCLNIGASFRPDGDFRGLQIHQFDGAFDSGDNDDGR